MKGIVSLVTMSAYQEKSDIWISPNGKADFLYSDLHEIKRFINEHYPKTAKAQKTAIVIETDPKRELAIEYAKTGKDLPRKIGVFPDLKSAKEWIMR